MEDKTPEQESRLVGLEDFPLGEGKDTPSWPCAQGQTEDQ